MKVLWITPQLPCLRGGAHVRQYHLLRRLRHRHQITVVSLATPDEMADAPALEALGIRAFIVPFDPVPPISPWRRRLETWRRHLLDPRPSYAFTYPLAGLDEAVARAQVQTQPDLAHLEHLFVAPCARHLGELPWVLTAIDVESQKIQRSNKLAQRPVERAVGRIEAAKLARWERTWVRRSAACIAMSEVDAAALRAMAPATPVWVAPNGVDSAFFAPPESSDNRRCGVLFFGNLGHLPNVDAVIRFVDEILPRTRAMVGDVTFRVVGPHATPEIARLGDLPGIEIIGYIPDIRSELWRATVSVVPLRSGGGTRLKILESLAAGCSVVSTTIGAEGLDLTNGRELVIADDDDAFAAAVVRLLRDARYRATLTQAGRQAVAEKYDWDTIAPFIDSAYAAIPRQQILC